MKNSFLLASIALLGTLSQSALADAPARLIWTDAKGFVSASGCSAKSVADTAFRVSEKPRHTRLLARVTPGSENEPMIESISDYVITSIRSGNSRMIGKTGIRLSTSFWQPSMTGSQFNVLSCGGKNNYLLFDVFTPGSVEVAAQVGVSANETDIFTDVRIDKIDEAQAEINGMRQDGFTLHAPSEASTPDRQDDLSTPASSVDEVVCLNEGHLQVRDQKLKTVLFEASDLDRVQTLTKKTDRKPTLSIGGEKITFIKVKFLDRDAGDDVGFVAERFVTAKLACRAHVTPVPVEPKPVVPPVVTKPVTKPVATPAPTPKPTPNPVATDSSTDVLAPNCAEKIILKAAKESVASKWGNRSHSGGLCALGVRYSLQRSHIGDVEGGLGNAVDYVANLRSHGFVDSGLRDIAKAPPGAILVFEGPKTDSYFRTGHFGRPAGNWLGHVTIKGGDGFYYTDGRTRDPAIGWSNGKNVAHIRNLFAILVPGNELISANSSKCSAQ